MHNMKENVNMNTLTRLEKSSIWVPQLVFFNTEEKVTTANDNKAFTVTRSTTVNQISVFFIFNVQTRLSAWLQRVVCEGQHIHI